MSTTRTWRLLTADELKQVYLDEMRRDFPPSELKPLSMILNSETAGSSHTWGVYEGETLAAYLLMVRPAGCTVSQLDYFAVLPQYRVKGLGRCKGHPDRSRVPRKGRRRGHGRP